jgi:hypothetical protein
VSAEYTRAGGTPASYEAIAAGDIVVEHLTAADWQRMAALITTYADPGLDAANASIIAPTERFNPTTVATLDTRDFQVVRRAPYHAGNTGSGKSRPILATNGQHATVETPVTKPIEGLGASRADLLENCYTREGTGGSNPPLPAPDPTEQVLAELFASLTTSLAVRRFYGFER